MQIGKYLPYSKCQYENFKLEKDNIAGGRIKATKLPLTKLWEAEAIGSIPKISNYQKAIGRFIFESQQPCHSTEQLLS